MPLKYPNLELTKYDCVNPDLSGVKAMFSRQELEKQLERKKSDLATVQSIIPTGTALGDRIQEHIQGRIEAVDAGENRVESLKLLAEMFQASLKNEKYKHIDGRADIAITSILQLYSVFDLQSFQSDFAAAFDGVQSNDNSKQVDRLDMEIVDLKAQIGNVWPSNTEELGKFFRNGQVPAIWREYRVVAGRLSGERLASMIFEEFLRDWRFISPLFAVPVTITGVEISSLPEPLKMSWRELYAAIGLGRITKRVTYIPRQFEATTYQGPGDGQLAGIPGVPERFKKRGRGRPRKESIEAPPLEG